jgi:hypothetical protein
MKAMARVFASLLGLGSLAGLCQVTAVAQTTAPVQTNAIVVQTNVVVIQTNAPVEQAPKEEARFHAGELDLSGFGVYVDKLPGNKWGGGAALTFYPIKDLGIGASTYMTDTKGTFFNNIEGEGYFRLPLLKIVAPYIVGGVGYQFDHDYVFETVGLGVDFRPFRHFSAFGDAQYRISNKHEITENGAFVRLGLRFAF